MTFYKDSSYDNITGEWQPGEWAKSIESDKHSSFWHYPPWVNRDDEYSEDIPIININSTYNIGKGHLFSGYVEHIHSGDRETGHHDTFGLYTINGKAKTLDEAREQSAAYRRIHLATFNTDNYKVKDGDVRFYHQTIHDKNGNKIGVEWQQDHIIPFDGENDLPLHKQHIQNMHKFLYDRNNKTRGGQGPMFSSKDYDHIIKKRSGEPADKELYSRVKSDAKKKFDVYPSAVANAWVVKEYKKRGGTYKSEKKKESSKKWYD